MSDSDVKLMCEKCGARPTPLEAQYTAELGGTHYRKHYEGSYCLRATSCGKWIEDKLPEVAPSDAFGRR
jgi:hypothetical protein